MTQEHPFYRSRAEKIFAAAIVTQDKPIVTYMVRENLVSVAIRTTGLWESIESW